MTSSGWAENDCEDNTQVTVVMVIMIVMVIIVQWTVSGPTTLTLNTASQREGGLGFMAPIATGWVVVAE